MSNEQLAITHVSDTAMWVAKHRADESERRDALFVDRFAKELSGDRGVEIAEQMRKTSRFSAWTVTIRTYVIDAYIRELIAEGVDMIVNLGAGLDTRPYRMGLPAHVRWIEVDYPAMIDYKTGVLEKDQPTCTLERYSVDLADDAERSQLFQLLAAKSDRILVITEGVIPYLTETQVAALARDLHRHPSFALWITEYFAKHVYRHLNNPKRQEKMRNAPFHFFPDDWFGFFRKNGWERREMRYLAEASRKLGRPVPMPAWMAIVQPLLSRKRREEGLRFAGYLLLRRGA